jgi:hypothetical protein
MNIHMQSEFHTIQIVHAAWLLNAKRNPREPIRVVIQEGNEWQEANEVVFSYHRGKLYADDVRPDQLPHFRGNPELYEIEGEAPVPRDLSKDPQVHSFTWEEQLEAERQKRLDPYGRQADERDRFDGLLNAVGDLVRTPQQSGAPAAPATAYTVYSRKELEAFAWDATAYPRLQQIAQHNGYTLESDESEEVARKMMFSTLAMASRDNQNVARDIQEAMEQCELRQELAAMREAKREAAAEAAEVAAKAAKPAAKAPKAPRKKKVG